MVFENSTRVDPCSYESMGLFENLPVRISKYEQLANKGCLRAQEDWKRHVGPIGGFSGCLSKCNLIAVGLPECLPGRIEAIAYANEVAFLHDDVFDTANSNASDVLNDDIVDALSATPEAGVHTKPLHTGIHQVQAKIMLDMISIDQVRAEIFFEHWRRLAKVQSATRHLEFKTIAEYLPHRLIDVGRNFWNGAIIFGMALTISDEEMTLIDTVAEHAYMALMLSNDYFSWQKEYDEFCKSQDSGGMANAIWIIAKEQSVNIHDATSICVDMIRSSCRTFCIEKKRIEIDLGHEVSVDLLKYLGVLETSISGNIVWSQQTERYNFTKDNKDLETTQSSDVPTICSSCGSSTNTSSTPTTPDLDTDTRKRPKDVHESLDMDSPKLSDAVIKAPSDYLSSLPSKGMRNAAIDALNVWYEVPGRSTKHISSVLHGLHTSSLMLDDIEDDSPLRRGKPATHCVFGTAQTINSANFQFVETLDIVRTELGSECLKVYAEELRLLHIGQSLDLHWTSQVRCPSTAEYMKMVDYKTGGLFRMLSRMLEAKSAAKLCPQIHSFMTLFSRYFQIRDDYQNLVSPDYAAQKGFCEDLDEGKFSLPLIHSLQQSQTSGGNILLMSLLQQCRTTGKATSEAKKLILEEFEKTGSLEHTRKILKGLSEQMQEDVAGIEAFFGKENFVLRLLLERFRIANMTAASS